MLAVLHARFKVARWLLHQGANPDAMNKSKHSALHIASFYGRSKAVRFLLRHGASWKLCDPTGSTALIWAVYPKRIDCVVNITSCTPSLGTNIKNVSGVTPLHIAASLGKVAHVKQLLRSKADPASRCQDGKNCLLHASNWQCIEAMLKTKSRSEATRLVNESDTSGWTLLHTLSTGKPSELQLLMDYIDPKNLKIQSDQQQHGTMPLHLAAAVGSTQIVQILLDLGHYVLCRDTNGRTPIWFADSGGHADVAQILRSELVSELNNKVSR